MTTWRLKTEADRKQVIKVIEGRALPSTVEIIKGLKKTHEQEKLARKWHKEAAEQGDMTAEEYRAYCKLHFGVAIMKAQSELYAEKYDRIVKPLPYEQKLELMGEPFDFPVTRGMTTANEKKYLDQVYQFYTAKGFRLTEPEQRFADEPQRRRA